MRTTNAQRAAGFMPAVRTAGINPAARRQGFTLLETLVVLAAIVVLLMLGTVALLGTLRVEQATADSFQRLTARATLAEQFRGDVGRAEAAPDSLDGLTAGPGCLILRGADGSHVVYQWQDGKVRRSERTADGASRPPQPVGPDFQTVAFVRGGPGGRLITLRLSASRGPNVPVRQLEIAAALGGDLR